MNMYKGFRLISTTDGRVFIYRKGKRQEVTNSQEEARSWVDAQ